MGKVIGSGNICIARLSDGYSSAVVMLYRSTDSTEKPLRVLYNFSTGELSSGVDGKTLTECLNGWSTERGTDSHYAISASVRSTEEYGTIETTSWSDDFLVAEKGETIVSVTLYQRAENAPERPSTALTYNFYTGEVTGSLGAWSTSIPDYTEYPLWSISATASAVLDGGTETDEINASEWSTSKKVAEDGKSPIEIFLSAYSYVFPADEDGIVKSSEYEKFSVEVLAVRGGKSVDFSMSAEATGISFITVSGNTVSASSSSAMTGDSATIKLNITAEGETYTKVISLAKAKQSKPTELWFAWSKSESIFTPKDSNFWIMGGSFIYYNSSLMGNIPFTSSWLSNWSEIEAAKTEEYCYLWCKTSESGTPFLFTGATGKTGACTMYQYALGDAEGNVPEESAFSDTMPTIQGTGKMLWTRYKVIPAGGLAGDVAWSEAKLVGTDNSEVYARITDTETQISEITKSGGLIEQAITEYDSSTGETMRTSISQNSESIKLKVGLSADGTQLAIGEDTILLDAPKIINKGTVTAREISVDSLMAQDLIVGRQIRSAEYNKDKNITKGYDENGNLAYRTVDGKTIPTTGFYLNKEGQLKACNAEFSSVILRDNSTIESDSFSTSNVSPTDTLVWSGDSFVSATNCLWYLDDIITYLTNNSSSATHTNDDGESVYYCGKWAYNTINSSDGWTVTHTMGSFGGKAVWTHTPYYGGYGFTSDSVTLWGYCKVTQTLYVDKTDSGTTSILSDRWVKRSTISTESDSVDLFIYGKIQVGPSYSTWMGADMWKYLTFSPSLSSSFTAKVINGTYGSVDVTGFEFSISNTILTLTNGSTTYTLSSGYRKEADWIDSYSLSYTGDGKGAYVSGLYPKVAGESNIGASEKLFNMIWTKEIHASNLINLIYPIGSIYISMKNTSPASFLGGSWQPLSAGYSFWTQSAENPGDGTDLDYGTVYGGLPNIAGSFSAQGGDGSTLGRAYASGAFSVSQTGTVDSGTSGSDNYAVSFKFDASQYNSTYGSSTHMKDVRPTAYKIFAWRRTA